ncbi:MAG: DUF2525 domain-containing protein [Giesbergeria sp.]|nr:DUF2525 domain-containing protein [Giesbergeria sp.]
MAYFQISANDTDMGEYRAEDASQALDAYAKEAGYADYADVVAQFGDDAEAFEIDTDALCAAVEAETGKTVFQDTYGSGVALVDGESFATHKELAESIGRDISDFFS